MTPAVGRGCLTLSGQDQNPPRLGWRLEWGSLHSLWAQGNLFGNGDPPGEEVGFPPREILCPPSTVRANPDTSSPPEQGKDTGLPLGKEGREIILLPPGRINLPPRKAPQSISGDGGNRAEGAALESGIAGLCESGISGLGGDTGFFAAFPASRNTQEHLPGLAPFSQPFPALQQGQILHAYPRAGLGLPNSHSWCHGPSSAPPSQPGVPTTPTESWGKPWEGPGSAVTSTLGWGTREEEAAALPWLWGLMAGLGPCGEGAPQSPSG